MLNYNMYKKKNILDHFNNTTIEHIFKTNPDGSTTSFPNIESSDIFERIEYLKWVAEGNTAEEAE